LGALALGACGGTTPPPGGGGPPLATQARIVVEPGSFLLTAVGAAQTLTATVFDDAGAPTTTPVTWHVADPSVLTVAADGRATAAAAVGATLVVARAGALESPPVVAIVAPVVAGAVLVPDERIVALAEDDPDAPYDLGWRYRAVLRGVAPLAPGDLLVGTGALPLGGRVVSVANVGGDQHVVLEIVGLDELFLDLRLDLDLDLSRVAAEVSDDVLADYDVRRYADGTLEFVPRDADAGFAAIGTSATTKVGPFKCESEATFPWDLSVKPSFSFKPEFRAVVEVDLNGEGVRRLGVTGTATAELAFQPRINAAVSGKIECDVVLAKIPLPIGGPVAFVVGAGVPLGLGFEAEAGLTLAQVGLDVGATAVASFEAIYDCVNIVGCGYVTSATVPPVAGRAGVLWPPTGIDEQFQAKLEAFVFAFADLEIGVRFASDLRVSLLRLAAGPVKELDLRTVAYQADRADYASSFGTKFKVEFTAGLDEQATRALERLLKITLEPLKLTLYEAELARSPAGTLTATPTSVPPTPVDDVGEPVTFRVVLDPTTYFGFDAVDRVDLRWRRSGSAVLEAPPAGCGTLTASADRRTHTCTARFPFGVEDDQEFLAFVHTRLFGVPLPIPLEIAADSRIVVLLAEREPVPPGGLAAGASHSLYAAPDGTVWGWGDDAYCMASADPDRGDWSRIPTPAVARGLDDVVAVATVGFASLALQSDGTLLGWGQAEVTGVGDGAQVGCGSGLPVGAIVPPQPVAAGAPVTAIHTGRRHALALRADGRVVSWGEEPVPGNLLLGRDTTGCPPNGFGAVSCRTPALVDGLEGIVAIAAADTHNLALDGEGRVWAWGRNAFGQLGYVGADTRAPVLVAGFPEGMRLVGIAAGSSSAVVNFEGYSLALAEDGTVWAWGANPSSVFGDPTAPARSTPALVVGLTDVVAIATRARHVLALDAEGVLYGWGSNGSGQVGVPEPGGFINAVTTPTAVLAEVDAFAVGFDYSLARGRDGTLWGWGANNFFKVGASPIPPDPFPPFEVREPVPLEPPATP